jgi:hypothetical protein
MIKSNSGWMVDLSLAGTNDLREDDINRRIIFSNVVFITLPVVYLIFMIVDYKAYTQPIFDLRFDQFIVPIEIAICLFCLWLNKRGHIYLSRLLFLATWPFFLHLIPIRLLHTPPDYYLAFPIGMVFHAVLIQLMIAHHKERMIFWLLIVPNFLTTIFAGEILAYFVADGEAPNAIVDDPYYMLDCLLYWCLFNLLMYYVILVVERYIRKLNESSKLIEKQRKELLSLNQGLEQEVVKRTEELEKQNEKLKGYAYYNAHLLRAPFCRIQGLIKLLAITDNYEKDREDVMPRLEESIVELEDVIKKIKTIVDDEVGGKSVGD